MTQAKTRLKGLTFNSSDLLKTLVPKKTTHEKSAYYDFRRRQQFVQNRVSALDEIVQESEFAPEYPVYTSKGLHKMIPMIRSWIRHDAFQVDPQKHRTMYALTKVDQNFLQMNQKSYEIPGVFRALFASAVLAKNAKFDFNKVFTRDNLVIEYSTSMLNKKSVDYKSLFSTLAEINMDGTNVLVNWPNIAQEMTHIKAIGIRNDTKLVEDLKHITLLGRKIPLVNLSHDTPILVQHPDHKTVEAIALLPNRIREHLHEYVNNFDTYVDLQEFRNLNSFQESMDNDPNFKFVKQSSKKDSLPPVNIYNKKSPLFEYNLKYRYSIGNDEEDFFQYLEEYGPDEFRAVMLDSKDLSKLQLPTELNKEYYNVRSLFKIFKTLEKNWFPMNVVQPSFHPKYLHLTSWDLDMLECLKRLNNCDPSKNVKLNIRHEMTHFVWSLFKYYTICHAEIKSRHLQENKRFLTDFRQTIFQNILKLCFFENKWIYNMYPNLSYSLNLSSEHQGDNVYEYLKDQVLLNKSLPKVYPSSWVKPYRYILSDCLKMEYRIFQYHYGSTVENRKPIAFKDLKNHFEIVIEFLTLEEDPRKFETIKKDSYFQKLLTNLTFANVTCNFEMNVLDNLKTKSSSTLLLASYQRSTYYRIYLFKTRVNNL